MNDAVSRKALNDLVKNRLSKVLVYASDAEEIKDPFDRGKATAYQNILHDISTKLPSVELEGEIESLKAITELAKGCLRWYGDEANYYNQAVETDDGKFARDGLAEIERLQNE